ncbi:polysaccharide biosynthesis protein [Solimicrobium silvestre]|uniref:Putative nucleoside-diphosphate sugar epimerase n=1 Tax=Solimicrobium silvestre TaxID=2099400 RepID=A0A2S9GS98_9BURK|nr:nucleoside-diphosphate sugar epimerase/dehydratase [Solimicrobium silvestre]PRC90587.1 putative nucleoside-diphosphate sugar epimerase [Solimicrobium silvestre]
MINLFLTLSRFQKQCIAACADMFFLPLMFAAALWMRFDVVNVTLLKQFLLVIIAAPIIAIPIFIRLGLYRAIIRFVEQKIVIVIMYGVTITVLSLLSLAIFLKIEILSRAVFGIFWLNAAMYMLASRFLVRSFLLKRNHNRNAIRVAIYGAGRTGVQMATALRTSQEYRPMFLIDDKKELQGTTIAGIRVYPSTDLSGLIKKNRVQEIHLVMPSISKKSQKVILDWLEKLHIKVKVTPPIRDLLKGELSVKDIREIEIEDLLGRDPVEPNPLLISACITGKTVLVSGAGGSIGSELCRQILRQKPARLIMLDTSEFALYTIEKELSSFKQSHSLAIHIMPFLGSVLDTVKCQGILTTFSVQTVYHAAAYKHVPLVEQNPIEGIRNNVFGTLSIARAAMNAGVANFVLISTDKAVRPTNVMGSTKRLAELILQAFAEKESCTRFCMVRFGNVLGSSGSVVPLFRQQIMAGGPITLTHPDITRYFMTIPEAAQLVLQAGSMGEGGDVFVLDMGEPVKIIDLAKRMVRLSGLLLKSESLDNKAIDIQHVGLRPGEKLYEELLIGENVDGTDHPLIMRAQENRISWLILQQILDKLDAACRSFAYEEVRALLLEAVREYQPQCGIEDMVWSEQLKQQQHQTQALNQHPFQGGHLLH